MEDSIRKESAVNHKKGAVICIKVVESKERKIVNLFSLNVKRKENLNS